MSNLSRVVFAAAALCLASCAKQQMPLPPSPEWVNFYAAPVRHAASFPEKPKASVKETAGPSGRKAFTYLHEVQRGEQYFATGWVQVPSAPVDKAGRDRLLDAAMAASVQSIPGGKMIASYKPMLNGYEGRMYTVDIPKDKIRLRQQIHVAGDGIVEQTYTGPAGSETDADAERFFASLELLP
jgi:hypothetical protein